MTSGIYFRTEKHRKEISDRAKNNKYCLGIKQSEETKRKISKSNTGKIRTEETKRKISESKIGTIVSDETRKKLSLKSIGNKRRLGSKHSEETKKKISISNSGEKSHRWIKDRSKLKKSHDKMSDYSYECWRNNIKLRDNWKCKLSNSDCNGRLESHHIFNWIDYPELRYEITNGITLCAFHHPKGRDKEKRMIPIFQELLSVSEE